MYRIKKIINENSFTELVYGRIRKKLEILKTNDEIEKLIFEVIKDTPLDSFKKIAIK